MNRLQEMRKKLDQQLNKNRPSGNRDNSVFPHWNAPDGSVTTLRFLPDGNEDNVFFWLEKQAINLTFNGIKGTDHNDVVTVQVPCVDMWKPKSCPITQEISPWFNTDMDEIARKYWKKRSYLFQGFVIDSDLDEDETPENPIRRFIMSKSLFKIIQDSILDTAMFEDLPTDYNNGTNFRIKKTKNGNYADYSTSQWDRRESALTEDQLKAIDENGLYNLSDYLPSRPSEEGLEVMFDMFTASLDDKPYDPDLWAEHFKPWNLDQIMGNTSDSNDSSSSSKVSSKNASTDDDDDATGTTEESASKVDEEVVESKSATKDASSILEQLRNRTAQS